MAAAKKAEAEGGSNVLENGVKLAGEAFVVPGSSLFLEGRYAAGGAHIAGGYVAAALIGPLGWLLAATSSFVQSNTGESVFASIRSKKDDS